MLSFAVGSISVLCWEYVGVTFGITLGSLLGLLSRKIMARTREFDSGASAQQHFGSFSGALSRASQKTDPSNKEDSEE